MTKSVPGNGLFAGLRLGTGGVLRVVPVLR